MKFGTEVAPKCCDISTKAILSQNSTQMRLNFVRQATVTFMMEVLARISEYLVSASHTIHF